MEPEPHRADFGHIHRTGPSVRFTESHATGNDTGDKAKGGMSIYGRESNCAHLAALDEERGYMRN